jgi:hypothetical protein
MVAPTIRLKINNAPTRRMTMTKRQYIALSNRALRQHNHITAAWYAKKASECRDKKPKPR